MGLGHAPENSSPGLQDDAGLNRDATLSPSRSEGEKLRKGDAREISPGDDPDSST